MKRLVVTGGRDYDRAFYIWEVLTALAPEEVFVGDCPTGVDAHVLEWCKETETPYELFEANWEDEGRAAGPIRNGKMLRVAKEVPPVLLLAFPGGRGTKSCMDIARRIDIPVLLADAE